MKVPSIEKWIPNLFLILLFEDGRKQGLGLWIVIGAGVFFALGLHGFGLNQLEGFVTLGVVLFGGGNAFDKWMNVRSGRAPDAPQS